MAQLSCWSAASITGNFGGTSQLVGRTIMIKNNKIISLAIIGLVIGGIIGAVLDSGQANALSVGIVGGVVGFLAGWVWNSRSGEAE